VEDVLQHVLENLVREGSLRLRWTRPGTGIREGAVVSGLGVGGDFGARQIQQGGSLVVLGGMVVSHLLMMFDLGTVGLDSKDGIFDWLRGYWICGV